MRWKNTTLGHLNNESTINREKIFQLASIVDILRSTYRIYHFLDPRMFSLNNIKLKVKNTVQCSGVLVCLTTFAYTWLVVGDGWLTFPC